MMETNTIVEYLCRLPKEFYSGSKSMMQLMVESGVENDLQALSVQGISAYLAIHLDLVEQWQRWSANKRASSGWYFTRQADGYIVGFNPKGEILHFSRPELACAEFVVREVQALIEMRRANAKQ